MFYWNAKITQCKYQKQSTRNKMKKKKKVVVSASLSKKKIAPNFENLYRGVPWWDRWVRSTPSFEKSALFEKKIK